MQVIGTLEEYTSNFNENTSKIVLTINSNDISTLEKLRGLKLNIELKEYKQNRSLNANAYFHVLCNEIAKKLSADNEETKTHLNCSYGTLARDKNGKILGCKVPIGTDMKEFYRYSQYYKSEENCDCYLFYKETHTLNSKEMSDLINGTIQEALNLGIEVKPKEEIESMLKEWDD